MNETDTGETTEPGTFTGCPQCGCDSFTHHQHYARNVLGLSYDEGWGMDNEWQEWDTCDNCGEVIE